MPGYILQQLFFDETEAQVLAIKARALQFFNEGKTIMQVEGGGHKGTKAFVMPPGQVLFEAKAALKHINPAVYGRRRTRTYARFASF